MSETEQRKIPDAVFERTREEIRDAIKLDEERRAALVKSLYRLNLQRRLHIAASTKHLYR